MPIFVIHEHKARHKHFDFRLQLDRKLKSWALRKVPPKKAGIKRLAIQTEDHPLSYATFKGEIKEGYGKGTVKIWDKGKYKLENRKRDKLVFHLHGKKLKGTYVILRFTRARKRNDVSKKRRPASKQWLFFKKKI